MLWELHSSGLPAGPVHPQVGNLVATRRGPRPIDLEGFSEDDNQDGFVDPIAPAGMYNLTLNPYPLRYVSTYAAPRRPNYYICLFLAPVVYSAPVVHAAPAVTYAAAPV